MYHYRQALVRMRLGDSDRQIAKTGLMGRRTASTVRAEAASRGWLDADQPLPFDETLASVFEAPKKERAQQSSSLEPYRDQITSWFEDGVQGTTIHSALKRRHGFTGSYSAVRRFLQNLADTIPRVTTVLEFSPGDTAQVDFGQGPKITDVHTGEQFKTWFFIMTLAWSRHQYAELVRDQSIETWLGCHRRAFEHFSGVPARILIDNPKCAITKACYYDPQVQRSYAENVVPQLMLRRWIEAYAKKGCRREDGNISFSRQIVYNALRKAIRLGSRCQGGDCAVVGSSKRASALAFISRSTSA